MKVTSQSVDFEADQRLTDRYFYSFFVFIATPANPGPSKET
jgi:hypothetical protein